MPRTAPSGLHATAQEAVVAALRETLLLPLDDLLAVTCEFTSYAIRQAPKSSRAFSVRSGERQGPLAQRLEQGLIIPWSGVQIPDGQPIIQPI